MNKMIKIGMIGTLLALSGCAAVVGTPAGLRAYGDFTNGYISNGKAPATSKSAHWQLRERETERASILERLFSRSVPVQVEQERGE